MGRGYQWHSPFKLQSHFKLLKKKKQENQRGKRNIAWAHSLILGLSLSRDHSLFSSCADSLFWLTHFPVSPAQVLSYPLSLRLSELSCILYVGGTRIREREHFQRIQAHSSVSSVEFCQLSRKLAQKRAKPLN